MKLLFLFLILNILIEVLIQSRGGDIFMDWDIELDSDSGDNKSKKGNGFLNSAGECGHDALMDTIFDGKNKDKGNNDSNDDYPVISVTNNNRLRYIQGDNSNITNITNSSETTQINTPIREYASLLNNSQEFKPIRIKLSYLPMKSWNFTAFEDREGSDLNVVDMDPELIKSFEKNYMNPMIELYSKILKVYPLNEKIDYNEGECPFYQIKP
jgi:hypothetical protein